jgi:hypothetical protein
VVAVVLACVTGVVAAVAGAANPVSAVQFLLPGHWVYNASLGAVFHVDGSSGSVDASARVPGSGGEQVFQGDTSGYVVGESRITEFGKSSLSVEESATPPSREEPVGVETAGGPYLVYRQAGKVVRLGDRHTVLSLGGPVGTPVATRDGTVWLPRPQAGLLCQLPARAKQVSCPVLLPKGHAGALSVVSDRLVFVDTTRDTVHVVEKDGLGAPRELGVDARDDARLASTDVAGRLAILDGQQMHLADAGLGTAGLEKAKPVTVDLEDGEYAGPVSTGSVVAVVNRTTNTLLTYDSQGTRKQTKELPPEKGDPRLTRGEDDRIYVDSASGEHVVVVDKDGELTDVPITEDGVRPAKPTGGKDPETPIATPAPGPPATPNPPVSPATPKPSQTTQPTQPIQPTQPSEPTRPPVVEQTPPPAPPVVPPSPPGAPTVVNATAGDASATVSWGPAPDNRSPVTGYRISWNGGQTDVPGNARTTVVPGLANGTTYTFTVTATNAAGTGPGAASNPVTPVAPTRPASAPTNLVVDYDRGSRDATMSWAQPADLGGGTLLHYVVSGPGVPDTVTTGQTFTFNDIAGTGTMTFTVRAVTQTPSGQVDGASASQSVEVPNGTVSLSRGALTQEQCAGDPDCAWLHIELANMRPNTHYTLVPHSTGAYQGPNGQCTTNASGSCVVSDQIAFHEEGNTVWVTATAPDGTATRSNDLFWESAS